MNHLTIQIEELAAHDASIRSLVRQLVLDDGAADDAIQNAVTRALERPPDRRRLRAWLGRVARNAVLLERRSAARRRARERATARDEAIPSTAEVVERHEQRTLLSRAVLALEEPYRTVILFRFYEDQPPREIARKLGVPVATVKSQIQRGLEKLRARLDREFGDRGSWCTALLPLIGQVPMEAAAIGSAASASLLTGALVMSTKIKIGIAILVVAACAVVSWSLLKPGTTEPSAMAPGTIQNAGDQGHREATVPPASEKPHDSAPREPAVAAMEPDEPAPPPGTTVAGIVVDVWTLRPVPGASVSFFRGRPPAGEREWTRADLEAHLGPTTLAGTDGRFRLEVPAAPGSAGSPSALTLFAYAEGYPMQYLGGVPAGAEEARLQLKAGMRLSGRTVDEEGRPVAFASLVLRVRSGLLGVVTSESKSESDGTFVLEDVPSHSSLTVEISAAGFVPRLLRFWLKEPPGELIVKLSRGREVNGRVIDSETREPIKGTSVELWVYEGVGTRALQHRKTGDDGRYRFEHVEALEGVERDPGHKKRPLGRPPGPRGLGLWVDAAGYAPAWAPIESGKTQEIQLYRSGAIEGLVLNTRGEPMADARVEARTRPDILVRAARLPSRTFDRRAKEPWACLWTAVTGADGRYRIERVASPPESDRIVEVSVRRRVWEPPFPRTQVVVVPGETVTAPPMTNPDPMPAWIQGRTVDQAGEPVRGVLVRTYGSFRTISGEDGRFRIPYPLPAMRGAEMYLFLSHCDFLFRTVPVSRAWRDGRQVLFRLDRGVELSGTVVDRHGRGVAGAYIHVRQGEEPITFEEAMWRHGTVRGADSRHEGAFSARVAPGTNQLLVTYPDRYRGPFCARFSLTAIAGADKAGEADSADSADKIVLRLPTLDLTAHRPVTLRIRVVDQTTRETIDRPLNADLLTEFGLWTSEAVKGAGGSIVIQKVPAPLEYELQLRVRGFGTVNRRILVSNHSEVCEHVIAIGGGGGVLRGRIVAADGLPQLPRVVVTAASGEQVIAPVEVDGRFEVHGLEAGTYVAELDAGHFPRDPVAALPQRVTVPAQGTATVKLEAEKAAILCAYLLSSDKDTRPAEPVAYRPRREFDEMSRLVIYSRKSRGLSMLVRDRAGRMWYRGLPKSRFLVPEGVYDVTYFRHGQVIGTGSANTGWKTWIRVRADFMKR